MGLREAEGLRLFHWTYLSMQFFRGGNALWREPGGARRKQRWFVSFRKHNQRSQITVHSSLAFWRALQEVDPNPLNTLPQGLQDGSTIIVWGGEK